MNWRRLTDPVTAWWNHYTDRLAGKLPKGLKRSGQWPAVRDEHLQQHPKCACCGGTKKLRVHHIEPFHVNPNRELDPRNLITLCEAKKYGINCHLFLGHLGNWKRWNPFVVLSAAGWKLRLSGRCPKIAAAINTWLEERPIA